MVIGAHQCKVQLLHATCTFNAELLCMGLPLSSLQAGAGGTWRASLEAAWRPLLRAERGPRPRHAALLWHGPPVCKRRLLCWGSDTCSVHMHLCHLAQCSSTTL